MFRWFELFHVAHQWPRYEFCTDLLFSDKYLLRVLATGIPNDFELINDEDLLPPNASALSNQQIENKIAQTIEIKLFTSLKVMFKARELDLTEVLK
jgi:hypothetical protein